MMDLLISIASNNKLNPIAYQIAQPSKYKGRPPNVVRILFSVSVYV